MLGQRRATITDVDEGELDERPADDGDEGPDFSEALRIAVIVALLVVDVSIIWVQIKDRPDVVVWRAKMQEAVMGPIRRRRAQRKAESHVVWEAIEVVEANKDTSTEEAP